MLGNTRLSKFEMSSTIKPMRFRWRMIALYKTLAIMIACGFMFAATFGMMIGMQTDEHGMMSGCPFISEQASVCPMGAMEHITKWQELFAAVLLKSNMVSSLVLLLLAVVIFLYVRVYVKSIFFLFAQSPLVAHKEQELTLFNYLVIIFSQGILNPRLYA